MSEPEFAEKKRGDKSVVNYTNRGPELYTGEEMEAVEQHIKSAFGPIQNIWHEFFCRICMWMSVLSRRMRREAIIRW